MLRCPVCRGLSPVLDNLLKFGESGLISCVYRASLNPNEMNITLKMELDKIARKDSFKSLI